MEEKNTQQDEMVSQGASAPKKKRRKGLITFIVILIIILAGGYYFTTYFSDENVNSEVDGAPIQESQDEKEVQKTVKAVKELILLPEGETPLMATVTDAESLRADQPFYANVANGDRILIYQQAQQAFIYSPSRDIIVNVGPIVINDEQAAQ